MRSPLLRWFACLLLVLLPSGVMAQTTTAPAAPAAPAAASDGVLKSEELDALLAPVALYPDTLLSLIMMASTYPLEVVQADRWLAANKTLKGDALKAAVDKQPWEESVRALTATPDVTGPRSWATPCSPSSRT
jgi:hypothetical protein